MADESSLVAAQSVLRKLRMGTLRIIGVSGRRGFFQEDIRLHLKNLGRGDFDFVEFDVWDFSDGGDLVFTMLGSIAAKATAGKKIAKETITKIVKALTYVGASVLLKASSSISLGDVEKALQVAEKGLDAPVIDRAQQVRDQLKRFFDEEVERKLVVLVSNLEKASKAQIDGIFNAVRYLSKASERLLFVVFFDDSYESAETTARLLRLCDSLIHLPHVTHEDQSEKVLWRFEAHQCPLTHEEKEDVQYFLSVMRDLRDLSQETLDRALAHFESSLEIIRERTSARLYLFVLALKYQFPESYRWVMENQREIYDTWSKGNPSGGALVAAIAAADSLRYPEKRKVDSFVRLQQVIKEGERAGL